ncbi:hypothetical protein [Streptococcus suis]|uniref:hypothetical protein n=1 Tax=Streptococcus suis TaxID=1307 RepID=UPI0038B9DB87
MKEGQVELVKELKQRFEQLIREKKYNLLFMAFVAFELEVELTEDNLDKLSSMYSIYTNEDQYTSMLSEKLVELGKEVGL